MFELSMTLPPGMHKQLIEPSSNYLVKSRRSPMKQSYSLPERNGMVQRAIAQFNAQIMNSHGNRCQTASPRDHMLSSDYASGESSMEGSLTNQQIERFSSKQRNLECAMLFCGLDLIQMHRASSSEWSDTNMSSMDMESEFQDDLEDVLRQSKWTSDEAPLSPAQDSAFGDLETEWWFSAEQADPTTRSYLHPTLVEKRKQLRRVESQQKEKIEQLHLKLEQLRLTAKKNSKKYRKQFHSVD